MNNRQNRNYPPYNPQTERFFAMINNATDTLFIGFIGFIAYCLWIGVCILTCVGFFSLAGSSPESPAWSSIASIVWFAATWVFYRWTKAYDRWCERQEDVA